MKASKEIDNWYRVKLITDWVDFDFTTPHNLGNGLILRKASVDEVKCIKERKLIHHNSTSIPLFESSINQSEDGYFSFKVLADSERWLYWVIDQGKIDLSKIKSPAVNFILNNDNLAYAASLLDCNLFLGFDIVFSESIVVAHSFHQEYRKIQEANPMPVKPRLIKLDEIKPFTEYLDRINSISKEQEYLKNIIVEFFGLNSFTSRNKFKTLAKFALIESLITHNPTDSGDTITKQIKAKVKLLNNRFTQPIKVSDFFKNGSLDKILSELYSFRSAIAHGSTYVFKGKILESEEKAGYFIDILLRRIIVQALKEPQLLLDLKEC